MNNSANSNTTTVFSNQTDITNDPPSTQTSVKSSFGQEKEGGKGLSAEMIHASPTEVQVPKEVQQAGVNVLHDTIELPPDVKNLGVSHTGATIPVATTTTLPNIVLPISDDAVVVGLHQQVGNALRWLAEWCIKRLKKAHMALKTMHGKIVRVKVG